MTTDQQIAVWVKECRRQEETCLYTSTSLFIWLRSMRRWRRVFVIAPIILGGIASWGLLKGIQSIVAIWLTATCGLLAGLFPAVFKALELDGRIDETRRDAAAFKDLQDRFRQAAELGPTMTPQELSAQCAALIEKLEAVRATSITPPERFFKKARKKIEAGDYSFQVDDTANQP